MSMRIGELAKQTGCKVETVRFYEHKGLLPEPLRSEANYRIYGAAHMERLHFIRRCRSLGMSLSEVQVLLEFHDHPEQSCGGVNNLIDRHITEIDQQIASLQTLHGELASLRSHCASDRPAGQCQILKQLNDAAM
jgi:Cd(II)/Pb(II)-responsive transcriptional regulator